VPYHSSRDFCSRRPIQTPPGTPQRHIPLSPRLSPEKSEQHLLPAASFRSLQRATRSHLGPLLPRPSGPASLSGSSYLFCPFYLSSALRTPTRTYRAVPPTPPGLLDALPAPDPQRAAESLTFPLLLLLAPEAQHRPRSSHRLPRGQRLLCGGSGPLRGRGGAAAVLLALLGPRFLVAAAAQRRGGGQPSLVAAAAAGGRALPAAEVARGPAEHFPGPATHNSAQRVRDGAKHRLTQPCRSARGGRGCVWQCRPMRAKGRGCVGGAVMGGVRGCKWQSGRVDTAGKDLRGHVVTAARWYRGPERQRSAPHLRCSAAPPRGSCGANAAPLFVRITSS